jgi:hypothetical protein
VPMDGERAPLLASAVTPAISSPSLSRNGPSSRLGGGPFSASRRLLSGAGCHPETGLTGPPADWHQPSRLLAGCERMLLPSATWQAPRVARGKPIPGRNEVFTHEVESAGPAGTGQGVRGSNGWQRSRCDGCPERGPSRGTGTGSIRWCRYGCNLHPREHDHGTNRHHDDAAGGARDVHSRPADDCTNARRIPLTRADMAV